MKNLLLTLLILVLFVPMTRGQIVEQNKHLKKIRGTIMMANSHIPKSTNEGKTAIIIPTWGFDADFYFHKRWSVALQGDIKLQSFEIEHEGVVLKRSYPIALVPVVHYHALKHWSFFVGPGYEFEKSENLFLVKMGTEYSFEITEEFEIALILAYENKQEVYDAWTFGIAFNKILWRKE